MTRFFGLHQYKTKTSFQRRYNFWTYLPEFKRNNFLVFCVFQWYQHMRLNSTGCSSSLCTFENIPMKFFRILTLCSAFATILPTKNADTGWRSSSSYNGSPTLASSMTRLHGEAVNSRGNQQNFEIMPRSKIDSTHARLLTLKVRTFLPSQKVATS